MSTNPNPSVASFAPRIGTANAAIASGGSLSEAIDLAGCSMTAIIVPNGWTAANLTFQVSADDQTFYNLYTSTGAEYSVTVPVTTGCAITLNPLDFECFRFLKVRSGTAGVPVNQGAAQNLTIIAKPVQ